MSGENKNFVRAMIQFWSKIERVWRHQIRVLDGKDNLSERDLALLEWLVDKGEIPFNKALEYLTKNAGSSGSSESASIQALARLSKKFGLLKAERTKEDERRKTIILTAKGRRLAESCVLAREKLFEQVVQCLGPEIEEHREQLVSIFSQDLQGIQGDPE